MADTNKGPMPVSTGVHGDMENPTGEKMPSPPILERLDKLEDIVRNLGDLSTELIARISKIENALGI